MTTDATNGLTEVAAGQVIFEEGQPGNVMYVIWRGKVEIYRELPSGRLSVAVLGRGDFFGEMAVIDQLPRSASAVALENCQLRVMDGATFMELVRDDPDVPVRLIRKYSSRLRNANARLELELSRAVSAGDPLQTQGVALSDLERAVASALPFGYLVAKLTGREYPLRGHEVTIGRADFGAGVLPEVDLTTEDIVHSVSRRHARIFRSDDGLALAEELGVRNGTWLNDVRVSGGSLHPLVAGDTLRIGEVQLTLELT